MSVSFNWLSGGQYAVLGGGSLPERAARKALAELWPRYWNASKSF